MGLDSSLRGLPGLFPLPPDEVVPLNLEPFLWPTAGPDLFNALRAVCEHLAPYKVAAFIGAAYLPRWSSLFVAAALRPQRVIMSSTVSIDDRFILGAALTELGLQEPAVSVPGLPLGLSEPERYRVLMEFAMGFAVKELAWSVPGSADADALDWLNSGKIEPGRYILCFPFASPSVAFRYWPVERFVGVLNQIAAEEELSVVLGGSGAEQHNLRGVAARLEVPVKVFAGTPSDFPLLCGIVAHAKAFLGNDTGLSHLAQALMIPGVVVFGGGTWPVYRPWSPGVTGINHSLPCYQCNWDCLFEHAFCVDRVSETIVSEQLRATLQSPPAEARVLDTSIPGDATHDLIRRANVRYRTITRDFNQMATELIRNQAEVQNRGGALERVSRELVLVRAEADKRACAMEAMNLELSAVHAEAEHRAQALEKMHRELFAVRAEAEHRAQALEEMHREMESVYRQADERARALEAMNLELSTVRAEAERRAQTLEEMHHELVSNRSQVAQRARTLAGVSFAVAGFAKLRDALRSWNR